VGLQQFFAGAAAQHNDLNVRIVAMGSLLHETLADRFRPQPMPGGGVGGSP
jgi:hypothetical protein